MNTARLNEFLLTTLFIGMSGQLFACTTPVHFDIQAQPVDTALLQFAQQAGVSTLFPSGVFQSIKANRVKGDFCAQEALDALLLGVSIKAVLDDKGQLVVSIVDSNNSQSGADIQLDAAGNPVTQDDPKAEKKGFLKTVISSIFAGKRAPDEARDTQNVLPEEIMVTGSRLPRITGMTAPTPVTAVTSEELTSFNPGSTVAEQLDILPQFFSTQTAQRGGTTFIDAGGSYLNLRGMGPNRTLVLLDGSRIIPSDSFGSVNVDNFPNALLKQVEIVTGGASAAYGADAISGVVNFVLDREFQGLKATFSAGATERGDGDNWNFSVSGGKLIGERLHFIGSAESRYIDQIDPDPDRLDNWRNWGHVLNPEWRAEDPPGTHPQRLTMPEVFPTNYSPQGLILTPNFKYSNFTFTDDGKGVRPYQFGNLASRSGVGATRTQASGPEYETWRASQNGGPDSNEVVQRSLFLSLKYDLTDDFEIFGQALLGRTESNAYGRRGQPALDSIWSATIYAENPFLPAEVRNEMLSNNMDSITVAKRGTVYGPAYTNYYDNRDDRNINQLESLTFGFNANLKPDWELTGSYQHGESKVSTSALNLLRLDNFYMALDAIPDAVTGNPVCHVAVTNPTPEQLQAAVADKLLASPLSLLGVKVSSPLGPMNFSDCAPINVFGLGNVSTAARDWVVDAEKKNLRQLQQDFYEVLLTGKTSKGLGAGPFTFATGLSYRAESFSQLNYPLFGERGLSNAPELGIRGIPGGFTGPGNRSLHQFTAIGVGSGDFSVSEWFGELDMPLLNLTGGQSLGSTFAVRSSDYSRHAPIMSWKAGLDFQLMSDLRWRFTRSRDVREPNFSEKFVTGVGGATLNDPAFNETYIITSFGGPNAELATELAYTTTTGFVYQPTFAAWTNGFQVAVDWYKIELSSAISRLGAQRLTNDCFFSGVKEICDLVQRNPDTNRVDRVIDRYFNIGGALTSGADMELQYFREIDFFSGLYETLSVRGFVGYLKENSSTTASGIKVDAVEGRDRPQYTANLSVNYNVGPYGIRLQQRYFGSTLFNNTWEEGVDVDDNSIASQSITNLALYYYGVSSSGIDWRAAFNITNLFDAEPPVIPGQIISNSYEQYGRRFQLSLNLNF